MFLFSRSRNTHRTITEEPEFQQLIATAKKLGEKGYYFKTTLLEDGQPINNNRLIYENHYNGPWRVEGLESEECDPMNSINIINQDLVLFISSIHGKEFQTMADIDNFLFEKSPNSCLYVFEQLEGIYANRGEDSSRFITKYAKLVKVSK